MKPTENTYGIQRVALDLRFKNNAIRYVELQKLAL